jgi:hypothetical protein
LRCVKELLEGCRFESADTINIVIMESLHLLAIELELIACPFGDRSAKNLEGIMWHRGHVGFIMFE